MMRKVMISAAAMTAFAAILASAPAGAVDNWGPKQVGNQCFTPAPGHSKDLGFGSWGACPQQASVAVPASTRHRTRHRAAHGAQ
jgi:hypothetical protein